MKHILVATDLSLNGTVAVSRALLLARQCHAEVSVHHIVHEDLPAAEVVTLMRSRNERLVRALKLLPGYDAARVHHEVVWGYPRAELLTYIEFHPVDLLVVGSHKKRPIHDAVLGTLVGSILGRIDIPCLITKTPANKPYSTVLVALDGAASSRLTLSHALQLAPFGQMHAVHVIPQVAIDKSTTSVEMAQRLLDREIAASAKLDSKLAKRVQRLTRQGTTAHVLLREAERLHCDLLAVGFSGRARFARALLGSETTALLSNPPCDLLIGPRVHNSSMRLAS